MEEKKLALQIWTDNNCCRRDESREYFILVKFLQPCFHLNLGNYDVIQVCTGPLMDECCELVEEREQINYNSIRRGGGS